MTRMYEKMVRTFTLTIETDADIAHKYPNWQFNYETPEEFVAAMVEQIEGMGDHPDDPTNPRPYGFRVRVTEGG